MIPTLFMIARNEFFMTAFNPMVIVVGMILLMITYLNAAGGVQDLEVISASWNCDALITGFSQIWYHTNFICGIMAAYLGVMSISGERGTGCLNVLLSKPLYRRDVFLGKYIGVVLFLLVFLVIVMVANTLFLLNFYGEPFSVFEFLLRLSIYTIILLMDLSLVTGITMFIGVVCKYMLLAVSVVIMYLSYEWFWDQVTVILYYMLNFPITPSLLTQKCLFGTGGYTVSNLFLTSVPLSAWISNTYPYVFFMAFLVVIVLLLDCFVYARMEDA